MAKWGSDLDVRTELPERSELPLADDGCHGRLRRTLVLPHRRPALRHGASHLRTQPELFTLRQVLHDAMNGDSQAQPELPGVEVAKALNALFSHNASQSATRDARMFAGSATRAS
jgi:hypothetical protein